ncbi:class I SAM-dependent methyltransferase [Gammaproteobacteria bacterium]|nr:class I SAM-dependent methyltransferase [Gammaproteobacteria bacterium]
MDLDIVGDRIPDGSSILEMGSVPLVLTTALFKCKYEVTGCDIAPERYSSTIEAVGLKVIQCDIERERLPFEDNTFDAVVFNEIFEHLRINPVFALDETLRVLTPEGTLMLSTPNLKSLAGIWNFLFRGKAYSCSGDIYEEYRKLEKFGHMGHYREYTTTEMIDCLEKVGFLLTEVIYRGRFRAKVAQIAIRTIPTLSPFVSYIARKPA